MRRGYGVIVTWRIVLLLVACGLGGCRGETSATTASKPAAEASTPIHPNKTQLVTVVTDDWDRFQATLQRYERALGQAWKPVGPPIDVVLGREGYGWGRGVHGDGVPKGRPGPIKREGDGRSPAGIFDVGTAYGYEAAQAGVSLRYVQATPELRCVDDPKSRHYNRIVSTAETAVDWQSAEYMRREDELYAIAIVVEHNTQHTEPGAGSCIFIHVWRGPDSGMTGCIAMPMDTLEAFAAWLEPRAAVLVALPRSEYDALRSAWGLP
jgi:D-alanyl-D-alanine dipeptidase